MKRLVRVKAQMYNKSNCDDFTGIITESRVYTESEFKANKHYELTDKIELKEGWDWGYDYDWNSWVVWEDKNGVYQEVTKFRKGWESDNN